MRRGRSPTIGMLALAALVLSGCGEDPSVEQGLVPFKGSDTSALAPLRDEMTRKMRDQSYLKKGGPDVEPGPRAAPEQPGPNPPPAEGP